MSILVPRPHLIEHNQQFSKFMANYHVRTFVKPGITGLAQVRGFRGEARNNADIENRVACDIEYLENWNLSLECAIILRTFAQLFRPPRSAYCARVVSTDSRCGTFLKNSIFDSFGL